jgi:hypothetical protein
MSVREYARAKPVKCIAISIALVEENVPDGTGGT